MDFIFSAIVMERHNPLNGKFSFLLLISTQWFSFQHYWSLWHCFGRVAVFLMKFSFLSHDHVFLSAISLLAISFQLFFYRLKLLLFHFLWVCPASILLMTFYSSLSDGKCPQQVCQNFSQYSSWSWQCWSLNGFGSSTDFHFLKPFLQDPGDHYAGTNYNWYYLDSYVPQFFQFLPRSMNLSIFSISFIFTLWSGQMAKSTRQHIFFFFIN